MGLLEYLPGPPCVITVNGWRHTLYSSCISWNRQNLAAEHRRCDLHLQYQCKISLLLSTFHQSWAGGRPGPTLYELYLWCRQSVFNLPTLANSITTTFCHLFCNLLIFTYTFFLYVQSIGFVPLMLFSAVK